MAVFPSPLPSEGNMWFTWRPDGSQKEDVSSGVFSRCNCGVTGVESVDYMDGDWRESGSLANLTTGRELNPSPQTRLVLEVLMVLMCVGAVTGNTLVISIIVATKSLHSVTSVLIMNLAISDLLVGVAVMPFVALSVLNNGWWECNELCLYVGYTSTVYFTASALTLAAIALDRYLSIMDCLRYSSRCTLRRTSAVVSWIWLQALVTSCPPLLGRSSIGFAAPVYSCVVDWAASPGYTAFVVAVSYFLPAAVVLFCNAWVVKVARGHVRRIHTQEGQVQRGRVPCFPGSPSQCEDLPSKLIYHVSGRLVSDTRDESTTESPPQNQHHHGLVRLFLVILSFFLCWTPYIGVALVKAVEAALSARTSFIPPSVVTCSYWMLLLNSDINPLLYALLSKRFQAALRGLAQKLRAGLGGLVGLDGVEQEDDPCALTLGNPAPPFGSDTSNGDETRFFKDSKCFHNPVSTRQDLDFLRVPSRPQEGSRLPFSALTNARQATFYYGNITVRVEHDVC